MEINAATILLGLMFIVGIYVVLKQSKRKHKPPSLFKSKEQVKNCDLFSNELHFIGEHCGCTKEQCKVLEERHQAYLDKSIQTLTEKSCNKN